jgi:hypothetical protein
MQQPFTAQLHPLALMCASLLAAGCPGDGGGDTGGATTTAPASSGGTTGATQAGTTAPTSDGSTSISTSISTSTSSTPTTSTAGSTTGAEDTSTGGVTGPDPNDPALDCAVAPCFNVINRCTFPIWVHAKNNDGVILQPDLAQLAPATWQQYEVPPEWPAGRINAYYEDPAQSPNAYDKVEVTLTNGTMNYNITYVDYVSLPSEMRAVGPECQPTADFDPKIGCYVPRAALLAGCPDGLLDGERCLSANLYCADGNNKGTPYCHALDEQIQQCIAQHPDTCGVAGKLGSGTPEVYGCAGYFDSQPPKCMPASETCHLEGNKWCAALNRGMLDAPDEPDSAQYYTKAPYNTYAKWVHDTCPGIYAFAYDDYPANAGESGFRACKAPRLDVVFCPAG